MMKKMLMIRCVLALSLGVLLLAGGMAHGVPIYLSPGDLQQDPVNRDDTTTVAYSWDLDLSSDGRPRGHVGLIGTVSGGAPGYGNSSFWSDVQGSSAGGGRDYTSLRIYPENIQEFSGVLTGGLLDIADLDAISYWTLNASDDIDWRINIYTDPSGSSGWYSHRIQLAIPNNPTTTDWYQHDTDAGLGVVAIDDYTNGSHSAVTIGGANDELSEVGALYSGETVRFMDFIASYGTNSPPSDAYIDGIMLTAGNGRVAHEMDLVPEPMSMIMLGSLGAGMFASRRMRRRKKDA